MSETASSPPPPRGASRRASRLKLALVPALSIAALAAVVLWTRVLRPPGTTEVLGVELGMRADEVMRAWQPREAGNWRPGSGPDMTIAWDGRGDARRVEPVRARFEFFESALAAVRVTFPEGTAPEAIVRRLGLSPVPERGGARTWDDAGSFCILMDEADGRRSLFLLDATSPRYEGEIELLRRVGQIDR